MMDAIIKAYLFPAVIVIVLLVWAWAFYRMIVKNEPEIFDYELAQKAEDLYDKRGLVHSTSAGFWVLVIVFTILLI